MKALQQACRDLEAVESRLQALDDMPEHTPAQHRELRALESRQVELLNDVRDLKRAA